MLKLSETEKDHLKIIIMDAEINHLNVKESLEYIKKDLVNLFQYIHIATTKIKYMKILYTNLKIGVLK